MPQTDQNPLPESAFAEHEVAEGDYGSGREMLEAFVSMYESGEQGCSMDHEAAMAVALAIKDLLAIT